MKTALESTARASTYARGISFAEQQVRRLVELHPDLLPMYTTEGHWRHGGELWTDWCGGFLAGMMWLFHQTTGDPWWRRQAERYSRLLEPRKTDRHVHDLGFIFLNSYRRWFEATGDQSLMDVVAQAGVTLAGRFQEKGQYLASFLGPHSLFIDIMMNVPLLFVAAEWLEQRHRPVTETAADGICELDPDLTVNELRRVATAHCLTSQRHLVRSDGSTVHEAIFDTTTGRFLRESTQQGLRSDSCWSRGQAWALYGFGTVYRHTRDGRFLETAQRCADYFLARLPAGRIPDWDFDAPTGPQRFWDSSAAAIAASGLLQLAELNEFDAAGLRYRDAALGILDTLCSDKFLAAATPGWEGILRHAVYHIHKNLGVDESVMWGDHFFVEALVKAIASTEAA